MKLLFAKRLFNDKKLSIINLTIQILLGIFISFILIKYHNRIFIKLPEEMITSDLFKTTMYPLLIVLNIITPLINVIITALIFYLIFKTFKYDIMFSNILRLSIAFNYINLLNPILVLLNFHFIIKWMIKLNIINFIYLLMIGIIISKYNIMTTENSFNKHISNITFISAIVLWFFNLFITVFI